MRPIRNREKPPLRTHPFGWLGRTGPSPQLPVAWWVLLGRTHTVR